MSEFIENKFWKVLPFDSIKHIAKLQLYLLLPSRMNGTKSRASFATTPGHR
jgi:hypothetical protein